MSVIRWEKNLLMADNTTFVPAVNIFVPVLNESDHKVKYGIRHHMHARKSLEDLPERTIFQMYEQNINLA